MGSSVSYIGLLTQQSLPIVESLLRIGFFFPFYISVYKLYCESDKN